jgi:hypothetical protein
MLTKREAAVISAYTGFMIGEFSEMHKYIEEKLQRPVLSHELRNKDVWDELKVICRDDFVNIPVE